MTICNTFYRNVLSRLNTLLHEALQFQNYVLAPDGHEDHVVEICELLSDVQR